MFPKKDSVFFSYLHDKLLAGSAFAVLSGNCVNRAHLSEGLDLPSDPTPTDPTFCPLPAAYKSHKDSFPFRINL